MSGEQQPIIIKKVTHAHAGHHGGSWKVAVADFALAMMALFLLLWLLNVTDDEQKKEISQYFAAKGAFRHTGSQYPIDLGGTGSMLDMAESNVSVDGADIVTSDTDSDKLNEDGVVEVKALAKELEAKMDAQSKGRYGDMLRGGLGQKAIQLDLLPEGLRIVLRDSKESEMFATGSDQLTPLYEDLLLEIAPFIGNTRRSLMISGHTDATPFERNDYSNWELSSDRAQVARKTLVYGGVDNTQILFVVGMADRVPAVQDPLSNANRRVELLVLTDEQEARLAKMLGTVVKDKRKKKSVDKKTVNQAMNKARQNQLPEAHLPE